MKARWNTVVLAFWLLLPLVSAQQSDIYVEKFAVREGLILVTAAVDGQPGTFIFDTGAPTLVLNSRLFDGQPSEWTAEGINGQVHIQEKVIKRFKWGNITKRRLRVVVSNLTHLEKTLRHPLMGLIGYEIIRSQEICLDYENQRIIQYKTNMSGLHRYQEPKEVLDFELFAHLPVITAEIDQHQLRLGLDTGAEANLLGANPKAQLIKQNLSETRTEELRGMNHRVDEIQATVVRYTSIDKNTFLNMKYVFTDLSHLRQGQQHKIDGLLGFPFFSACKISINYRKQKIYIWEGYDRCQLDATFGGENWQKGR